MNRHRLTRSAAVGLAIAAFAAPTAAATTQRDLRSPDARDAARAAEPRQDQPRQDLRSPDARDSAKGTFSAPDVTVVKVTEPSPPSGGFDWGDAGIGAGSLLGVILLGLGTTLAIVHRRQGGLQRRRTATTG